MCASKVYWFRLALFSLLSLCTGGTKSDFEAFGISCKTDKVTNHVYHHTYNQIMHAARHRHVKIFEIGLGCTMSTGSASICLWQGFFQHVDLWMMDIDTKCAAKVQNLTRNTIIIGDQSSEKDLLSAIQTSGGDFDFIIDDGSHNGAHQLESFRVLWSALKPGGSYFVEDIEYWRQTGKLGSEPFPAAKSSRDKFVYWADELLSAPGQTPDIPDGLMSITFQREMVVLNKCPLNEERCPF